MTPVSNNLARVRRFAFGLFCLLFVLAAWAQTPRVPPPNPDPEPDGPYVVRNADGGWQALSVEVTPSGAQKRVRNIKATAKIVVPAVGAVPAFNVKLRKPADMPVDELTTSPDVPLFVVADTHGEFEILVEMLRRHHIVDRKLRWSFGRGHLIFLGDMFDRGPNHTEIFWLIYQLEAEAKQAGGGVHMTIGNHEAIVLDGDLRYMNPKYPKTVEVLGVGSYNDLFAPDSVLGQWLRTKPAVLKVNDLLCMHGGISRAVVDRKLTLAQINATVRAVNNKTLPDTEADRERAELVMERLGPMWYRGYFPEEKRFPTATDEDVGLMLEHFDVRKILVGHTIVPTITPLYDNRIIAVQVYPRRDEQTGAMIFESLLVKGGKFFRARIDGGLDPLIKKEADGG